MHIDPVVFVVRFYDEGKSFDNKDKYRLSATLQKIENTGHLIGLSGDMSRVDIKKLTKGLHDLGIEHLYVMRHGIRKTYDVTAYYNRLFGADLPKAMLTSADTNTG